VDVGNGLSAGRDVRTANGDAIRRIVGGAPIDAGGRKRDGVRIVVNVACANVVDVLAHGFLNRHELAGERVGDDGSTRNRIDAAIADIAHTFADDGTDPFRRAIEPDALHYAALELNGAGVRYFGDMCLVIDPEIVDDAQVVLEENSYNVGREPVRSEVGEDPAALRAALLGSADRWSSRADLIARKVLAVTPAADDRLLTIAAVGRGILDDEEYIEVPLTVAVRPERVTAARTTAGEMARELAIASAPGLSAPPQADLVWLSARRRAARALSDADVPILVVTHEGRQRL
jgi:hypothetical protein